MERTLERFSPAFSDALEYFSQMLCQELEAHTARASKPSDEGKETV